VRDMYILQRKWNLDTQPHNRPKYRLTQHINHAVQAVIQPTQTAVYTISNSKAYIAETTSVSTQCAYFRQFLAYFTGTLGISLPNSEGIPRGPVHTRLHRPNPCVGPSRLSEETKSIEREGI
jgi:hypothetical protein